MKLAVDIGNRNICICYNDRGSLKFDSFQSRFSTELQQDYSGSEVIEINNVKYCIEQGMYDFEFNKSNKQYLPLLLCAIARSTKDEKIELMISAPVEHVLGLRDELKNQLEGKSFKFLYNNKPRRLTIERLGVIGEGFSTYFTLERHVRASIRNLGILDIGGRTTNVVTFVNGKQHTSCSINKGILDVKNTMLKKEKECGKDYDIITIENLIENKRLKIDNISKKQNQIVYIFAYRQLRAVLYRAGQNRSGNGHRTCIIRGTRSSEPCRIQPASCFAGCRWIDAFLHGIWSCCEWSGPVPSVSPVCCSGFCTD